MSPISVPAEAPDGLAAPTPFFLSYDGDGNEFDPPDNDGFNTSADLFRLLETADPGHPYTDAFVISHGWLTTRASAMKSYEQWVRLAVAQRNAHRVEETRPGYNPIVVWVHWPSDPKDQWGKLWERAVHYRLQWMEKTMPALSFYRMKGRAFAVGQKGLGPVLQKLSREHPALKVHLMGHSFGAIVVSAAAAETDVRVDSAFLIEAAMSTWSFARALKTDRAGNPKALSRVTEVVRQAVGHVDNIVVGSRSTSDHALRFAYPIAESTRSVFWPISKVREPVWSGYHAYRFGALGFHGVNGPLAHSRELISTEPVRKNAEAQRDPSRLVWQDFAFTRDAVYNVDASDVVVPPTKADGKGWRLTALFAGSHSQIMKPEIANLYWQSAGFPLKSRQPQHAHPHPIAGVPRSLPSLAGQAARNPGAQAQSSA